MLGRNSFTQTEIDSARGAVAEQMAAYGRLARAVGDAGDPKGESALQAFEPQFFNDLVLVLDRYFVHRVRAVSGKDGNPLNEVELLADSLMNNDGVLRGNKVIKLVPEASVLGLELGAPIRLTADDFGRLAEAFFADLQAKFG